MGTIATHRQRHFSAAERAEWISLYRSSQLPASQFAQQQGLKLRTLYGWLRRGCPRSSPDAEVSAFQEVHFPSFLPTGAWVAEIALPDGVVVPLDTAARPPWIKFLLQTLRQAC